MYRKLSKVLPEDKYKKEDKLTFSRVNELDFVQFISNILLFCDLRRYTYAHIVLPAVTKMESLCNEMYEYGNYLLYVFPYEKSNKIPLNFNDNVYVSMCVCVCVCVCACVQSI